MKKLLLSLVIVSGLAVTSLHAGEAKGKTCDKNKAACNKTEAKMCPKAQAAAKGKCSKSASACSKSASRQAALNSKGATLLVQ